MIGFKYFEFLTNLCEKRTVLFFGTSKKIFDFEYINGHSQYNINYNIMQCILGKIK